MSDLQEITGRIQLVWTEPLTTSVTDDVAAGETVIPVDDASIFNARALGKVLLRSQVVAYTHVDDEPSTITLDSPLEEDLEDGDDIAIWSTVYDLVQTRQRALVDPDTDDDLADQYTADVLDELELLDGDRGGDGETCTLRQIGPDSWELIRVDGRPADARGIHFESEEPAYTPTAGELTAGVFTHQLLHRNIVAKHGLFTTINGVALGSDSWTLDAKAGVVTVTVPDWVASAPDGFREFGWPMYAYRRGLAVTPPEGPTILLDEHYEDYPLGPGVGYFPSRGYDYTIQITGIVAEDSEQGQVLAPSMPSDAHWSYQFIWYQRWDPEGSNPIMTPLPTGVASAKICRKAIANPDPSGDIYDIGAWPLSVWAPNGSDASPGSGSPEGFDLWCRIQIPSGTEGRVLRFINDACSDVNDNYTHFDTDPFIEDDVWYEVKIEWAADGSMVYTVHQDDVELSRWETSYIPTRTPVDAARMGGDAQAFYTGNAYYTLTDDAYFATWSL